MWRVRATCVHEERDVYPVKLLLTSSCEFLKSSNWHSVNLINVCTLFPNIIEDTLLQNASATIRTQRLFLEMCTMNDVTIFLMVYRTALRIMTCQVGCTNVHRSWRTQSWIIGSTAHSDRHVLRSKLGFHEIAERPSRSFGVGKTPGGCYRRAKANKLFIGTKPTGAPVILNISRATESTTAA